MRHNKITTRMFSLAIFIAFLVSLIAAPVPVFAATLPDPVVAITLADAAIFPDQAAQVTITQTLGNYSTAKNNVVYDTQITLDSGTVNLGGLVLQATDLSTGTILGTVTLLPSQTKFWMSAFGGSLSRHAIKKDANKTRAFKITFTPSSALAGANIQIRAQIFAGENKVFNNGGTWSATSALVQASERVLEPPVMTASDFSGPYTQDIERPFTVDFYNPLADVSYSGLMLDIKIGKYNDIVPAVSTFQYQDAINGWTTVSLVGDATGTLSGTVGPVKGFDLPGGAAVIVPLRITFTTYNKDVLFPASLELRDKESGLVVDRISATLAVNTQAATLTSDDLGGVQNPYKAGVAREFHVSAINPGNGKDYSSLNLDITLLNKTFADVSQLQYFDPASQSWKDVPAASSSLRSYSYPVNLSGYALMHDSSVTVKFRMAFAFPATYSVKLALMDGTTVVASQTVDAIVDPTMPSMELANFPTTFTANAASDPFNLIVTNPPSGQDYSNVHVEYTISGTTPVALADVLSVECLNNNSWQNGQKLAGVGTVTGSLPPISGQPLGVAAPANVLNYQCRIAMATEGSYTFTFKLVNGTPSSAIFPAVSAVSDVIPADVPPTGGEMFLFLPSIRK